MALGVVATPAGTPGKVFAGWDISDVGGAISQGRKQMTGNTEEAAKEAGREISDGARHAGA